MFDLDKEHTLYFTKSANLGILPNVPTSIVNSTKIHRKLRIIQTVILFNIIYTKLTIFKE